jgi:hypothetical protein
MGCTLFRTDLVPLRGEKNIPVNAPQIFVQQ